MFCPAKIDTSCLEAIADRVISEQPEEAQRQALALDYAAVLLSKTPDHASRLVQEFSQEASWQSLRRIANQFAEAGQKEEAATLIWAALEARAQDPNPRNKVLDMLLMVENAAAIDDLDLARRIHGAIVCARLDRRPETGPATGCLAAGRLRADTRGTRIRPRRHQAPCAGGRPRKLADGDLAVARALLRDPTIPVAQFAGRLGVSRTTFYTYFPQARTRGLTQGADKPALPG